MQIRHILLYLIKIILFSIFVLNKLHFFKNTFNSKYIEDLFAFFLAVFILYLFYPFRKHQIDIDYEDRVLLFGTGTVLLYGIDYKNIFLTSIHFLSEKNIIRITNYFITKLNTIKSYLQNII